MLVSSNGNRRDKEWKGKELRMYDVVIIGAGPGGLAAAIYAQRAELSSLVIERAPVAGGQIINTYEVDNYPGIPGVSGYALAEKMQEHCKRLGVVFQEAEVQEIADEGNYKRIVLTDGNVLETKTKIAATGAVNKTLGVPGEEELAGMGVSYCATCDGAFFKNRVTAVVGGGDVAVEDAIFLARLCKKVYLIHRRDSFRAAKTLVSALGKYENIELVLDSVVDEIHGEDMVEAVTVHNVKSGEVKKLEVNGVFLAVGTKPNSELFAKLVTLADGGWIEADETCRTNCPGIYAVGDVRTKQLRQVVTAAADGANAITSIEHYLAETE